MLKYRKKERIEVIGVEAAVEKPKKKRKSVKQKNVELAAEGKKLKLFGFKLRAFPTAYQKEQMVQFAGANRVASYMRCRF